MKLNWNWFQMPCSPLFEDYKRTVGEFTRTVDCPTFAEVFYTQRNIVGFANAAVRNRAAARRKIAPQNFAVLMNILLRK